MMLKYNTLTDLLRVTTVKSAAGNCYAPPVNNRGMVFSAQSVPTEAHAAMEKHL
jgi:hypothetical protein